MENNCTMVAYTEALEEDEIELSLGLSIGGTLRKSKKSKPMDKELVRSIDINTDLRESDNIFSGSSLSPVEIVGVETDFRFDPQQTKREIHALRRQEARRKRGEKQMKKRKLEAHREMREEEEEDGVVACKREKLEKTHDTIGYGYDTHETRKQSVNQNLELDSSIFSSTQPFSVVPMQYQYPPVQYVPFAFPYVMPCWMPGAGTVDSEKNVVHPAACRSFRPFQAHGINCGLNFSNECDSEQNNDKDGTDGKPIMSNDSPGCGSSAISENRSISLQGDSSSESGSDSSHSKSSKPQLNNASTGSDTQGYSEHSASSHPMESGQGIDKETTYTEKVVSNNTKSKEEAASETQPDPVNKPISTTGNPTLSPLKETKGEMGKPPKPQQNQDTPSLPQMPCVSATGNGPNGKTITGFLYRYTKTEVSIVCGCHGSSFSPAEFVKHAGGIDVSHPLRHITVVSSAFG